MRQCMSLGNNNNKKNFEYKYLIYMTMYVPTLNELAFLAEFKRQIERKLNN